MKKCVCPRKPVHAYITLKIAHNTITSYYLAGLINSLAMSFVGVFY